MGFVDDCCGSINDFESNCVPIHNLMRRAKFDAQLWSNLLSATGDALQPNKVKHHISKCDFSQTGELATFKEPAGNNLIAWEHVRKNAITKATKIFNSSLDANCVFRCCHSIFPPSVLCGFPANSIPSAKLDKLTNQVTRLFLPRLGYD